MRLAFAMILGSLKLVLEVARFLYPHCRKMSIKEERGLKPGQQPQLKWQAPRKVFSILLHACCCQFSRFSSTLGVRILVRLHVWHSVRISPLSAFCFLSLFYMCQGSLVVQTFRYCEMMRLSSKWRLQIFETCRRIALKVKTLAHETALYCLCVVCHCQDYKVFSCPTGKKKFTMSGTVTHQSIGRGCHMSGVPGAGEQKR